MKAPPSSPRKRGSKIWIPAFAGTIVFFTPFGCGYTNQTVLPQNIRTIHIDTVQSARPVEDVFAYVPGLEIKITNAIIRRLHRDGNLKVVPREQADGILQTKLTGFQQEGVRFTSLESVEEYRLFVVAAVRLVNGKTREVIWEEPNFSGDAEYFVRGLGSISRGEAAERAVDRLARNIVDRIVEDW